MLFIHYYPFILLHIPFITYLSQTFFIVMYPCFIEMRSNIPYNRIQDRILLSSFYNRNTESRKFKGFSLKCRNTHEIDYFLTPSDT